MQSEDWREVLDDEGETTSGPVAGLTIESESTALVRVNPQGDLAVIALHQEGIRLRQYAEVRVVAADGDVKDATNDLSIIVGLKKAIEEKRKEYVGPINDHLGAVNEAFKAFVEPLLLAETITRRKILDYRAEQEAMRQEQERINRLRIEAAEAEMKLKGEITESVGLVETAPVQPDRYRTEMATLGKATIRKFEVVDFSILPDEYKLPDMVKIRKVVTAGATIPGVRTWKEETLRVTSKREG